MDMKYDLEGSTNNSSKTIKVDTAVKYKLVLLKKLFGSWVLSDMIHELISNYVSTNEENVKFIGQRMNKNLTDGELEIYLKLLKTKSFEDFEVLMYSLDSIVNNNESEK